MIFEPSKMEFYIVTFFNYEKSGNVPTKKLASNWSLTQDNRFYKTKF